MLLKRGLASMSPLSRAGRLFKRANMERVVEEEEDVWPFGNGLVAWRQERAMNLSI
jgi:hypothetical protein